MASTRYRVIYLRAPLRNRGVRYTVREQGKIFGIEHLNKASSAAKLSRNLFYAACSDALLIQKAHLSLRHLDFLLRINENVVFDLDDAIYAQRPWSEGSFHTHRRRELRRVLQRIPYATVGSPAIAEHVSQFCDEVLVAPTSLPRERYEEYSKPDVPSSAGPFVVGWVGNDENLWYLQQIESQLRKFLEERDDAILRIVTASSPQIKPLEDRDGDDVHYVVWSEEREMELLDSFDVAIRPLTDDEWTRSKGGFTSVIQCMGTGTPVVVSPVGMLDEVIEHGNSGFHASSSDDWNKYLNHLAENDDKRYRMGQEAFRRVGEARFWNDQRADDLASFYRSIVN